MLNLLSKLPYMFIVVILTIILHMLSPSEYLSFNSFGIVLFVVYVVALVIEFAKSANTGTGAFTLDLIFSVAAVVAMTAFITHVVVPKGGDANAVHWFGALAVLVDAILSPLNSFRAALRDFGGGGVMH